MSQRVIVVANIDRKLAFTFLVKNDTAGDRLLNVLWHTVMGHY